jgi:ABC-type multidrug transport system permease subunit
MVIGLVIMTLYLNVGNDFSYSNLPNIPAILYFGFCVMVAYGAVLVMPSILLERALFIRERSDGLYHVITYLFAKAIEELIIAAIISAIVAAYNFYGIKFQGQWVFFWLSYFITWDIGIVLGYLVASISPNLDAASALYPTYVSTLVFFGGFVIRPSDMPPWWYWYSRIDFLTYGFGGMMVNQFGDNNPQFQNTTMLEYYSLNNVNKWAYLGYLSLFYLVFFILTWLALSFINHSKR